MQSMLRQGLGTDKEVIAYSSSFEGVTKMIIPMPTLLMSKP